MLFVVRCRNHHQLGKGTQGFDMGHQVKARAISQVQIHQQHIKIMQGRQATAFSHAGGLCHQADTRVGQQVLCNDKTHVRIILCQQHPCRPGCLPTEEIRPKRRHARHHGELMPHLFTQFGT
jgi:hypothetical protein